MKRRIKWMKIDMSLQEALDLLNPDKNRGTYIRDRRGAYKKIEGIIKKLQEDKYIQCEICDAKWFEGCMCCRKQVQKILKDGDKTQISVPLKGEENGELHTDNKSNK